MGFLVIDPNIPADAIPKLKLPKSPPTSLLLPLLKQTPTRDLAIARRWFEFLAMRLSGALFPKTLCIHVLVAYEFLDFSPSELQQLSSTAFIPVAQAPSRIGGPESSPTPRLLDPKQCYLGGDSSTGFHSQLFTFVDFGPHGNNFLTACGVRREPTVDELAKILVSDPRNFYKLTGGLEK